MNTLLHVVLGFWDKIRDKFETNFFKIIDVFEKSWGNK